MLRNIYKILFVAVVFSSVSCDKMLDIKPKDRLVSDQYWKSEADVEGAIIGCYGALTSNSMIEKYLLLGDARADIMEVTADAPSYAQELSNNYISYESAICKWSEFYTVINRVNTTLYNIPKVKEYNSDFAANVKGYNNSIGECLFLRSLVYFYLVRTFDQVPWVGTASVSDDQYKSFSVAKDTTGAVMDSLERDLKQAKNLVVESYTSGDLDRNRGRVTKMAVQALLTDVYLWRCKYKEAAAEVQALDDAQQIKLVTDWYTIFYPGNTEEEVFELEFSNDNLEYNQLPVWFSPKLGGKIFYRCLKNASSDNFLLWTSQSTGYMPDYTRGSNATYIYEDKISHVWKWIGTSADGTSYRTATQKDSKWIFYRGADIYLMGAEAENGLGNTAKAMEYINHVKERAGLTALRGESKDNLWEEILSERGRELAFEGKRWFDLVRFARRNFMEKTESKGIPLTNEADWVKGDILITKIAQSKANVTDKQLLIRAKLSDPRSWFLPIHRDELKSNLKLVQNPYYKIN